MKTHANAPVYPDPDPQQPYYAQQEPGLTKREYFAAMAMQGILANGEFYKTAHDIDIGKAAVKFADALIEELNESK